ncbi:DUF3244 domain-containing protein [Bacteroides sp.]
MKHFLVICISLLFCTNSFAEEIYIQLYNSLYKDTKIDKRSLSIKPTVTHDENTIYIYSNIPIENLQIIIKDTYDNSIYLETATILPEHIHSFTLNNVENGEYKIELTSTNESFYGYFLLNE